MDVDALARKVAELSGADASDGDKLNNNAPVSNPAPFGVSTPSHNAANIGVGRAYPRSATKAVRVHHTSTTKNAVPNSKSSRRRSAPRNESAPEFATTESRPKHDGRTKPPEPTRAETADLLPPSQAASINNTITEAASLAGLYACERMVERAKDESSALTSLNSVIMPSHPEDLLRILKEYVGDDLLDAKYVPDFVMDHIMNMHAIASKPDHSGYVVTTFKFVHQSVAMNVCVVCDYQDMITRHCHVQVVNTVAFALDAIAKLASTVVPFEVSSQASTDISGPRAFLPDEINVACMFIDEDRFLPDEAGQPLDVENVNAGVTIPSERRVFVYRSQHLEKVLLHEMIHCCGLDAALQTPTEDRAAAEEDVMEELDYVSDTGELSGYEAYTEVLACYWHMFMKIPKRMERWPGEDAWAAVHNMWRQERNHYLAVCALIVRHFAFAEQRAASSNRPGGVLNLARQMRRAKRQMRSTSSSKAKERKATTTLMNLRPVRRLQMEEHTHVFSYFFEKASLWLRLDEVPALPVTVESVAQFWEVFVVAAMDVEFWNAVVRASAPSSDATSSTSFTMTSLSDGDDETAQDAQV